MDFRIKRSDSTLSIIKDPFRFISSHCRRTGVDLLQTRFFLRKILCMTGKEAASLFYNAELLSPQGFYPLPLGGVSGSSELLSLIQGGESLVRLKQIFMKWLQEYSKRWIYRQDLHLYTEVTEILTRSVCEWAGVALLESEAHGRARDLVDSYDSRTALKFSHFWRRGAQRRTLAWLEKMVLEVRRAGDGGGPEDLLHQVAWRQNEKGRLLKPQDAAVEMASLLDATVAASAGVVFLAHALHLHPECRLQLRRGEDAYLEAFVQEVQRFYPFSAGVFAKVRAEFSWRGYVFKKHLPVVLDLYGLDHDARLWDKPEDFRPERFHDWQKDLFGFIPPGNGDYFRHHRRAPQALMRELMKAAVNHLVFKIRYEVPAQNLDIFWSRLPAIPKSHLLIENVRLIKESVEEKSPFVFSDLSFE